MTQQFLSNQLSLPFLDMSQGLDDRDGSVIGLVDVLTTARGQTWNAESEDAFWRENYQSRPYVPHGTVYEIYQPAYRYGWESSALYPRLYFEEVELDLKLGWSKQRGSSPLDWEAAKWAVRDGWDHTDKSTLIDFIAK